MLRRFRQRVVIRLFTPAVVAAMFVLSGDTVDAQVNQNATAGNIASAKTSIAVKASPGPKFTEYRGVSLGMSAEDARQKLGKPKDKDKTQDLFVFSDNESAQVFYDAQQKVYAISIDYAGKDSAAPAPIDILGQDVAAKMDGSIYQLQQYWEVGYWVSYNRTAGKSPIITVTMQRITRPKE